MSESIIAVTGATGFIGRCLVERLLQKGMRVEIVTRQRHHVPQGWQGCVSIVEEDIANNICQLSPHAEVVFHCAGETQDPRRFWRTNVEGTRNILNACVRNGIKRLVYLSSVGVMGIEKPGTFDEMSPCMPRNDYERSKLEAERLVLEAAEKGNLSVVILRPSIVYGPGKRPERDSFLSLIRSIKNGYFRYVGSDKSIYNIVYVADVVEALLYLALNPEPEEEKIFIINDPMTWKGFVTQVHSILSLKHKVATIPKVLALGLALGCQAGNALGMKLPFSVARFKTLTSGTIFSSEKIKKESGFKFLVGSQKGIESTIDYYCQQNLL